jgi:spore coat polysaccharide biosynthesis predicted glycosyltransferase SpsG
VKKIFFRTDFNNKIGFGHFYRCFSIAEIVEKNYQVNFVFNKNITSSELINAIPYPIVFINEEKDFFTYLQPGNIIVIDSYDFNEQLQNQLNELCIKLVVIDDLNNMNYDCNAVINHGVLFSEKEYKHSEKTKFYLGLDYLMVRKEFRDISIVKSQRKPLNKIDNVFICFGGSNQETLIKKTVDILSNLEVKRISILASNLDLNELLLKNNESLHIEIYENLKPDAIIYLLQNSDFAILPGSTILLEAFTVGIPIISGWFAENQRYSLEKFEKMGLIINLDNFKSENYDSNLINAIKLLKNNFSIVMHQKKHINLQKKNFIKIFDELT